MKFPLNGKYTLNEVFLDNKRFYLRKMIKIPNEVNKNFVMKQLSEYKKQLGDKGIHTTKIYNKFINKKLDSILLIEHFYIDNLEIEIGVATEEIVMKYFYLMLMIINRNYLFGKLPKIIVEVKPSNFVLNNGKIVYCDLVPPRIMKNHKISGKQLDFTYKNNRKKLEELKFRFLSKEGALYYMILHTAAVRPNMSSYFVQASLNDLKNIKMKKRMEKLLSSDHFQSEVERFKPFYETRRTAYQKFRNRYKKIK